LQAFTHATRAQKVACCIAGRKLFLPRTLQRRKRGEVSGNAASEARHRQREEIALLGVEWKVGALEMKMFTVVSSRRSKKAALRGLGVDGKADGGGGVGVRHCRFREQFLMSQVRVLKGLPQIACLACKGPKVEGSKLDTLA
jgi:hypothetical protein